MGFRIQILFNVSLVPECERSAAGLVKFLGLYHSGIISLLTALNNEVLTMVLYCKISTSPFIINKYLRDVLWFECEMSQASPCTS